MLHSINGVTLDFKAKKKSLVSLAFEGNFFGSAVLRLVFFLYAATDERMAYFAQYLKSPFSVARKNVNNDVLNIRMLNQLWMFANYGYYSAYFRNNFPFNLISIHFGEFPEYKLHTLGILIRTKYFLCRTRILENRLFR